MGPTTPYIDRRNTASMVKIGFALKNYVLLLYLLLLLISLGNVIEHLLFLKEVLYRTRTQLKLAKIANVFVCGHIIQ